MVKSKSDILLLGLAISNCWWMQWRLLSPDCVTCCMSPRKAWHCASWRLRSGGWPRVARRDARAWSLHATYWPPPLPNAPFFPPFSSSPFPRLLFTCKHPLQKYYPRFRFTGDYCSAIFESKNCQNSCLCGEGTRSHNFKESSELI